MVFVLNDFVCVLPDHYCSYNICHILCTCIYLYEYSCGQIRQSLSKNVSDTEYKNTNILRCVVLYDQLNFVEMKNSSHIVYSYTASLLNDFACVLPVHYCSDNIYHILCTCIYLYEYSYGNVGRSEMKNSSHIGYKNTSVLQCVFCCEWLNIVSL